MTNVKEKVAIGQQLKAEGKLDEAIEQYNEALKIAPRNIGVLKQLARVYEQQEKWGDAASCYQKVIAFKPDAAAAYLQMGKVLKQQKKLYAAVAAYQQAIELQPDLLKAENYKQFGDLLLELATPENQAIQKNNAIAAYQKAVELQSDFPASVYVALGDACKDQQKYNEAVAAYSKAIEIEPNLGPEVHQKLGDARLNQGYYELSPVIEIGFDHGDVGSLYLQQDPTDNSSRIYLRDERGNLSLNRLQYIKSFIVARKIENDYEVIFLETKDIFAKWIIDQSGYKKNYISLENKSPEELQREFQIAGTPIYFTIKAFAGLTDQLMQFSIYYKLGILAGYRYIHTPFESTRSSSDIFDYLGFNSDWDRSIHDKNFKDAHFVELSFDLETLDRIVSLKDLLSYTRSQGFQLLKNRGESIIIFVHKNEVRQKLANLVNGNLSFFPDRLSLLKKYVARLENLGDEDETVPKDNAPVNLLIHIRLGDIAHLRTPWGTYLNCRQLLRIEKDRNIKVEYNTFKGQLSPDDFYDFSDRLLHSLGLSFEVSVFSDGYQRAIELIQNCIDLSNQLDFGKKTELKSCSYTDLEEKNFRKFKELGRCDLFIGESDELLQKFVHSILIKSDIIVTGGTRLVPKLLANYYPLNRKPIVIILSKDNYSEDFYITDLGLSEEKVDLIPVNLLEENYDLTIHQKVKSLLEKRGKFSDKSRR